MMRLGPSPVVLPRPPVTMKIAMRQTQVSLLFGVVHKAEPDLIIAASRTQCQEGRDSVYTFDRSIIAYVTGNFSSG